MQRKNGTLKMSYTNKKTHKNAIAMIMAIVVIVIISTIMALSLSLTTQTVKKTKDLYLYEQVVLLSKSATEYALLRIAQDNNITHPCNYTGDNFKQNTFYDINISVKYIYTAFPATCNAPQRYATVTTAEQSGSILIDVSVSINDESISSEQIRYSRRTIQKL
jgi:type II secretory pathway pseudopilin PulG